MKKLNLLLVTLAFTAGGTFAQTNFGVVMESGQNQKATIGQTGIQNQSYVDQSNNANTADVTQSNFNVLYSTQSDVIQSGERNDATVKQISTGTLSGATQIGVLQASVDQKGNDNKALQLQGPHNQQGLSFADIIQGGNANFASQHQLKYGNEARINQSGSGNIAEQAQDSELLPDEDGSYNFVTIGQSGHFNTATQKQDGWANEAIADQSGSNNISTQLQKDYSWKNFATVSQSGNWNTAIQTQLGALNSAKIDQASSGNTATQTQTSVAHRASAVYDPLNIAEIYQMGGDGNIATQIQDITLGGDIFPNTGIITQDGWSNTALQTQTGGDNLSTVSQTGNFHNATVTQSMSVVQ